MNQNINYVGMLNLLRKLQTDGLVSRREVKKSPPDLKWKWGRMSYFLFDFCALWIWTLQRNPGIVLLGEVKVL